MDSGIVETPYHEKAILGKHPDGYCPKGGKNFALIYTPPGPHHPEGTYTCSNCGAQFKE